LKVRLNATGTELNSGVLRKDARARILASRSRRSFPSHDFIYARASAPVAVPQQSGHLEFDADRQTLVHDGGGLSSALHAYGPPWLKNPISFGGTTVGAWLASYAGMRRYDSCLFGSFLRAESYREAS